MKEQPAAATLAPTDLIDSDHPEVVAFFSAICEWSHRTG